MLHSNQSLPSPAKSCRDATPEQQIAVVCHELRNSVAVVRGAARLLPSTADGEALKTLRSLIDRQLDQIVRHIDDLAQPQLRNGHLHELQLARVDLRAIAGGALAAIAPEVARCRHSCTVTLPKEPVWALVDGARIEQAISNLLINAVKFTPAGGDITLRMDHGHGVACLRVGDSGVGIDASMLPQIFGLFVQVGTALPALHNGSGIGLTVVRDVVELHGGTVTATSPGLGLGSEFVIVLPTLPE